MWNWLRRGCRWLPSKGRQVLDKLLKNTLQSGHIFVIIQCPREKEREKMAKLYFKYGAMGSSKTAQALITKYNYASTGPRVVKTARHCSGLSLSPYTLSKSAALALKYRFFRSCIVDFLCLSCAHPLFVIHTTKII